MFWIYEVTKFS